jgi:hypothetical protein
VSDESKDNALPRTLPVKNRTPAGVANVALCFAALLFLAIHAETSEALPSDDQGICAFPYEVASEDDWTSVVGCGEAEAIDDHALRGPARLLFGLKLDLNQADVRALEVLPRIGPRRASAIVSARDEMAFTSVADLARVRGIGAKTIEDLSGWVAVGGRE